jgi:hypothetical protein
MRRLSGRRYGPTLPVRGFSKGAAKTSLVFDQREAALAAEAAELRQQNKEVLSHCVDLEKVLFGFPTMSSHIMQGVHAAGKREAAVGAEGGPACR